MRSFDKQQLQRTLARFQLIRVEDDDFGKMAGAFTKHHPDLDGNDSNFPLSITDEHVIALLREIGITTEIKTEDDFSQITGAGHPQSRSIIIDIGDYQKLQSHVNSKATKDFH
jgi:hypothetical protein